MTLEEFLPLLSGVQRVSTGHMATCPAHDDNTQSLHIAANGTGLGLKCHAGCSNESILAVMCLKWDDLFYEEKTARMSEEIVATYDYTDEQGKLLFQALRYQPKSFKQRSPNGNGGWTWNTKGVRRVPYMLPEILASDDAIFIVEGEKDVHTLRVHGFTATTNAGGAGKWTPTWNEFFRMRKVIIIPDRDQPGFDHANQIAEYLRPVADVRYILLPAKDTTEWFLTHSAEEFNRLVETADDFDVPLKLNTKPKDVIDWLKGPTSYGLLGEIVQLLEPHTEADPLAMFVELVATFGSCLGPGPHFRVGGTYHRCNLFVAVCGETGKGRKGTAHDWVKELFRHVDPTYVDTCIIGGLASGEGIIHSVRDPKVRTLKDGSVSVLDDGVSDKRRLFFESELAGRTFVAMKRDGSTMSAIIRQAWESTTLSIATKQNDDKATGAHISIVGHATVQELLTTLRVGDIVGGFANRFLFFIVRRSKMLAIQSIPSSQEMTHLAARLSLALQNARKISQVTLADEAIDFWVKLYTELDADANDDDLTVAPFLSRAAPQIIRLAMILTLVDGKNTIGVPQLKAAQSLWACARQAVEFMTDSGSSSMTPDQQLLFNLLSEAEDAMSCVQAREALGWSGARFAIIKAQLHRMHYIDESKERGEKGGRPRQMLSVS